MSKTEKGRSWKVCLEDQRYQYTIFRGLYFKFGRYHFHFNPGMLCKLLFKPHDILVLAVSWNDFNIIIILLLKRLHLIHNKIFIWSEANNMTAGARKSSKLKYLIRRFLLNTADAGIILPGEIALRTLSEWGVQSGKRIFLPNMIQEYDLESVSPRNDWPHSLPNVIIPARISEKTKGQLRFFSAIGMDNIRRVRFHLLGDGPDEKKLHEFINNNHLSDNILMEGFADFKTVASSLKAADFFCLPSLSDPCPLAIYEAMAAGIPLLISKHCGNWCDAVKDGDCGEVFDPLDKNNIITAFERMMNRTSEWIKMGAIARKRFKEHFSTDEICRRFIEEINM